MERKRINKERLKRLAPNWSVRFYQSMSHLERIALSALVILFIASGAISLVRYISVNTHLIPQAGGVYREAAVGQPRNINPILAPANDLDNDLSRLIYNGLLKFDNNLELVNDLATNVEISENQQLYTITIRPDVTWHDGEPFTADDVLFTIRSIQTPEYGSPLATSFQGVTVDKIDDQTVTFRLTQPYAPFLSSLTVGIVPAHVWSQIEPQNATLAEQMLKPIGTGPFKFAELTTRRRTGDITAFHLIRNEDFYGHPPLLDQLEFTFYINNDEAIQALRGGKVDGIGFLSLHALSSLPQRSTATHRLLLPQYFAVFFNQQKNEALGEAGVRSALALATDREEIVRSALQSQGQAQHLPIPPSTFPYQGELTTPSVDLEAAKQNLSESGWEEGEDGIRVKDGNRLTIKITTTDWPEYVATAVILQTQWRQIGVAVELEHLGAGAIQQTVVQPRNYEALLFGEILPAEPDPYPFWHSTQTRSPGLNLALFKDQDVDKLLEEARKATDPAVRLEKLAEFQNKILELNPAIILYQPFYLFAAGNDVRGIDANLASLPADRFNNIEAWHVNVKRVWND